MKKVLFSFLVLFTSVLAASAQQDIKYAALDSSPVDIVYYPLNAAKFKDATPLVKVIYSRPHKKGRIVFGGLEQYGKLWRLGANENTEIKFFNNVIIGKKKIKKGTYGLFAIPEKGEWTFIISKQNDIWGAFSYDPSEDVVRVKVPVETLNSPVEDLSITFVGSGSKTHLMLAWDDVQVKLPITIL